MKNSNIQMAEKLKNIREANGLTQQQVAQLLNRPQSYVSRCEKGIKNLDIRDLDAFCRIYNTSVTAFLEE